MPIASSRRYARKAGSSSMSDRPEGECMARIESSRPLLEKCRRALPRLRPALLAAGASLLLPRVARAQGVSPWENAVTVLMTSFTGPIARGLSLVSIVVGGVTFAFGEGGSKRLLAGIVFGVGMAIGAVNFMAWLFP